MSSKNPIESNEGVFDASTSRSEYEVFLNFRGPDTRMGFTDHLYVRLIDAGIQVYRDDEELREGEKIGSELLKGIKQSKIAIPIFSKDYAASKWCLKELVQIVECRKTTGLKVMPIFYDVTPDVVKNQTKDYEEAFKSYEKHYDVNTINNWRKALREVGELKGWDVQNGSQCRKEGELVKNITNIVLRELKKAFLEITEDLVGLDPLLKEISNIVTAEPNGVTVVGIHGMGGIGKTTLGKAIYNHLVPSFENHCFLANVREICRSKGVGFLQEELISNILKKASTHVSNVDEGIRIISERFPKKKVLLLLDDVDEIFQLRPLIGKRDWFRYGSKIIITTRNKSILDSIKVDHYHELRGLATHHALQLFSQHAFRKHQPPEEYAILSQKIVEIAGGLPLALEVFGSFLCGRNIEAWESTMRKWKKVPHDKIGENLMISFEALKKEEKQIFLDIACYFIGFDKKMPIYFWKEYEFPEEAIEVLQEMSLIKIGEDDSIWMHDLLRDLGREIVRREHLEPEKRSRLWDPKEATKIFMRKMGSDDVRAIFLKFEDTEEDSISMEEFAKLPNLRLLDAVGSRHSYLERIKLKNFSRRRPLIFSKLRWLKWHELPYKHATSNFSLEDLVVLDLSYSKMKSHWSGWSRVKMAKNLKVLNLTGCTKLVKTPSFSSHLKLEHLILKYCSSLVEIDESIGLLEQLVIIDLEYCESLRKLPEALNCTESLEVLDIRDTRIQEIPNWAPLRRLNVFRCSYCDAKTFLGELVDDIKKSFGRFNGLQALPESIGCSESLIELDISDGGIVELPDTIGYLKNLKTLKVRLTPIRKLPTTIGMLENLTMLDVSFCWNLEDIPRLPQSLTSLKVTHVGTGKFPDISNLINLKNLELHRYTYGDCPFEGDDPAPSWIGRLINLEKLQLSLDHTVCLHADWGALSQLTDLHLSFCIQLQSIPKLPSGLKFFTIKCCKSLISLKVHNCKSLQVLCIDRCSVYEIDGLEMLENLSSLDLEYCEKLQKLEFHNCKSLQALRIKRCSVSKIDGLEMLKNLVFLEIWECEKLETLPDFSKLTKLVHKRV